MTRAGYEEKDATYFQYARPEIARKVPVRAERILDVGCGEGAFGAQLKRERPDLEVWGIEPTERAAAVAQTRLTQVFCGPVESALASLPDGGFDCITLNDVLEHMTDPWIVLASLRSKLAPNGIVLASIPNLRYFPVMRELLFGGDFPYARQGVLDSTHLRFFTRRSMLRLFTEAGYAVNDIEGHDWVSFPWLLRALNQLTGRALHDMHFMQFIVSARVSGTMPESGSGLAGTRSS